MRRALLALLVLSLPASSASARGVDPAAKARLDALVAAYKALGAYADEGSVAIETKIGGAAKVETIAVPVAVARPNKLRVKTPLVEIVSDGKTLTTSVPAVKKFFKSAAPAKLTHNDLVDGPLGSFERGGPSGMPLRVLLTLLLDEDPADALLRDATGVSIDKDVAADGVTYSALRIESDVAPPMRLWIDPKSKLVARIELLLAERITPDSSVPGNDVTFGAFRWTAGKISTDAGTFDASPAKGLKEIVGLDAAETEKSRHELVGKPAPEFVLNVRGSSGKTARTTVKDYAGKVVLIDFWAMWCGPCRKEMPDIGKLAEALEKAGKPATIVALSIDQPEEADIAGLEKKVLADIKTLGFDPDKLKNGVLAFDPSGTTARAFGVGAIPTLVLIDGKGVVRSVHVGLTERDVLEAEIEALVAGRPLPGN